MFLNDLREKKFLGKKRQGEWRGWWHLKSRRKMRLAPGRLKGLCGARREKERCQAKGQQMRKGFRKRQKAQQDLKVGFLCSVGCNLPNARFGREKGF